MRDDGDITAPDDVRAVWRLVDELAGPARVTDSTFDARIGRGRRGGVVEVVATAGYYTTLAMT